MFILPLIKSCSLYFKLLIWIDVSFVVQYVMSCCLTMDFESNPKSLIFFSKVVTDKPVIPPQRKRESERERHKRKHAEQEKDEYFPHSVCSGNVMCVVVSHKYLTFA